MITRYVVLVGIVVVVMALVPYANGQAVIQEEAEDHGTIVPADGFQADNYKRLNCCGKEKYLNIVIASAINGDLIAIDGDSGELVWKYDDEPLLRGSLSAAGPIEVGGSSLQLMPTLDGRLFSYAHQSNLIEPLPITTESLLESTVRLGRDAVAGGKTVTTTGIDVLTGEIKYKCSPESCDTASKNEYSNAPILLVKRISNSIRAMDSLRGTERWNLSTAELDLSLAGIGLEEDPVSRIKFLLRPPDGVITAVNEFGDELWTSQISGHIVNVWHVLGNSIKEISLFDPRNIYTTQYEVGHRVNHNLPVQSSLFYMGTSNGYPFIIQSPKSKQTLKKKMREIAEFDMLKEITAPRLCSANAVTRNLAYEVAESALLVVLQDAFRNSHSKAIEDKSMTRDSADRGKLTIVADPDESGGSRTCSNKKTPGVALIGTENLRSTSLIRDGDYGYLVLDSQSCSLFPDHQKIPRTIMNHASTLLKFFSGFLATGLLGAIYTIRRFKKRITTPQAISACSSYENVQTDDSDAQKSSSSSNRSIGFGSDDKLHSLALINDRKHSPAECQGVEVLKTIQLSNNSPAKTPTKSVDTSSYAEKDEDREEKSEEQKKKDRLLRSRTVSRTSAEMFVSRFAEDFEVEKIIGHGGFGVVFRARSVTDANDYAVKRIAVADNERARNRVMREARALAGFDHPGIIRYFYAWEERPPRGFQEMEDENLLGKMKADKLRKLRLNKNKKAAKCSNIKSVDSLSHDVSLSQMPQAVGHTAEESWSVDVKPQKIGALRTTSESKRGLVLPGDGNADGDASSSLIGLIIEDQEKYEANGGGQNASSWSTSSSSSAASSSSSETDSSSSDEDENEQVFPASSSGGIQFVDSSIAEEEKKVMKKLSGIREELSLKNRAVIVEDENHELKLRQTSNPGDCAYLYIVMQLCEERTLEDWIRKNNKSENRPLATMKQWIKQLADALEYLHGKGFIHRDLKPGNIFFSLESKPNKKILKIGDLGLATKTDGTSRIDSKAVQHDVKHTKNVGTRSYMSPEQLGHQRYTEKVDIFALGLVATEMIIPFSTSMERQNTFAAYQKGLQPEILNEYPESRDFLLQLTNVDISQRPSAEQIVEHPFFA